MLLPLVEDIGVVLMQPNTASRKAVREAEKKARQREVEDGDVLVKLMTSKEGRAYIWRTLESANVFGSTYNDNPQRMALLEGIRSSGLQLLNSLMQWCPDLFIQAMRESNERRINDQHDLNTAADADTASSEYTGSPEPGRESEGRTDLPTVGEDGQVHYQ